MRGVQARWLILTVALATTSGVASISAVVAQSPSTAPTTVPSPATASSPGSASSPSAASSPGASTAPAASPLALTRDRIPLKVDARATAVAVGPDGTIVVATAPQHLPSTVPSQIWVTADGVSFTAAKLPGGKRSVVMSVASTADGFVAVGFIPSPSTGQVWTSADGRAWKLADQVPGASLQTVVATETGVLIGGAIPRADSSVQPGLWSLATAGKPITIALDGSGNVAQLAATPDGGWLAAGTEAQKQSDGSFKSVPHLWSSADATTWTAASVPGTATWITALANVNDTLLLSTIETDAGNSSVFHLWTSTDGVAWQDAFQSSVASVASVVAAGAGAYGFETGAQVVSTDMRTWQQVSDRSLAAAWPAAVATTAHGLVVLVGGTIASPFHPLVWTADISDTLTGPPTPRQQSR